MRFILAFLPAPKRWAEADRPRRRGAYKNGFRRRLTLPSLCTFTHSQDVERPRRNSMRSGPFLVSHLLISRFQGTGFVSDAEMASAIDPTAVSDCGWAALRGSTDFDPRLRLPWPRLDAGPQGTIRWSHGSLLCPFRFVGECSDPVSAASRRLPIGPESAWRSSFPTGRSLPPRAGQVKHFRASGRKCDRMLQARRGPRRRPPDIVLSGGCVHSPFFSLAASPRAR